MSTLEEAIQNIRMGNHDQGRQILESLLDEDENNEDIWLWMSTVVDGDEDREICLENVLALNPNNLLAKKGLDALKSGIFNTNDLLQDLIDDGEIEEEEEPATFIDDFVFIDDDDLDDEDLRLPGEAKKARKKGGGINIRYVILGVLTLVLLIVLGALAATSLLLLGNDSGGDTTAPAGNATAEQAPAGGEVPEATATPVPTDTPTAAPTDTPTVTGTPRLQLPTAAPTRTASPTSTRVVSPTPIK